VAINGKVQTANLGLEPISSNIVANRAIGFLLICGKESARCGAYNLCR